MDNVLLIGGCGYIGSRLFQVLSDKHDVDSVDAEWYGNHINKLNVIKDFGTLTKDDLAPYDVVILLAGHSSVKMCVDNAIPTLKNNVVNFVNLLEKLDKKQMFIYASSSSVYGDTKEKMVTEEYNQFEPNNYYDLSKHEIDSYAKLSSTKYFGLRFGTVCGASPNLRNDIMINAMTFNAIKNLASFNSTAEKISRVVAHQTGAELEFVVELPKTITNVKLQTKAYNFLIDSTLFEQTFNFEFKEDINTIVRSLVDNFDNMNKGNRSDVRIY